MEELKIQDLLFNRDSFKLQASLFLDKGQIGVILGPSGGGKTTLLRLIAGLEQIDSGTIYLGEKRIDTLPPEKRDLSFMFQDLALFDHLDGRDNLAFGLRRHRVPEKDITLKIEKLGEKFQIGDLLSKKPWAMSGGERQRLALARALAVDPELLLLDEPFSSLDAPLRRELRTYIRIRLKENGTTALHVTHDVDEAMELGDVLLLMRQGSIVAHGTPSEVCATPADAWCANFLGLGWLLPVNSLDFEAQRVQVRCAKHLFTLPLQRLKSGRCSELSQNVDDTDEFLFCPKEALTPLEKGKMPQGATFKNLDNTLEARIQRIIQDRDKKRVVIDARSLGFDSDPRGPDGLTLPFEFNVPNTFSAMAGDSICIHFEPTQCWVLPAYDHPQN
jgi:ABC-type Fe3+/spermidine/putrescine transport system ATPase subunit